MSRSLRFSVLCSVALVINGCDTTRYYRVKDHPIALGEFTNSPDAPGKVETKNVVAEIRARKFNAFLSVHVKIKAKTASIRYLPNSIVIETSDKKYSFRPESNGSGTYTCSDSTTEKLVGEDAIALDRGCEIRMSYSFDMIGGWFSSRDSLRLVDRGLFNQEDKIDIQLDRFNP